ncbi:proteinase-activated receptor 1-like [Aquarana catesbeiana]|uniref:proteinase-activated receptor 1-like n=1 Tax=Aquarana catesbeiana TaxID=8400 RepID=UPI003CC93C25
MAAISACQAALSGKIEAVQMDVGLIRQDLDKKRARLGAAEQKVGRVEDVTEEHSVAIRTLQNKVKVLEYHADDAENRSRRNNLRIVGFAEGAEGQNPATFVEDLLRSLLPGAQLSPDRDELLQAARVMKEISYQNSRMFLFPDYTVETQKQRRSFKAVKAAMRAKGINTASFSRVDYELSDLRAYLDGVDFATLPQGACENLEKDITLEEVQLAMAQMQPGVNHVWTINVHNASVEYNISSKDFIISPSSWWLTRFVPSFYTVVVLLALPLNIVAIFIFVVKMKVKKPSIVYMLNLAATDIIFVCILPFRIVYRFSGNNWIIGEGMCRFVMAVLFCNMYCSILLMTSISIDRFIAVVFPVRSLAWRTVNRAWLVCGIIWIISLVSIVPLLIARQTYMLSALNITTCYDVLDSKDLKGLFFYYFIPYLIVFFVIPLIVTTLCYIGTICSLCLPHVECRHRRSRAIYLTAVVLFVFALCFGPTNILFLTSYLLIFRYNDDSLNFAYILSASMSSMSCCLNPIIYYYASSQSQTYIHNLLCCKRANRNRRNKVAPALNLKTCPLQQVQ